MKNPKKIILIIIFQIFLLLFFSACWNNFDINDKNIVFGMGIEKSSNNNIKITVEVFETSSGQTTSTDKQKEPNSKPKQIYTRSFESESVFGAIRGLLNSIDKKLFFSTAQVLIIGENLAKDGIEEVLDFFSRDHEIQYKMNVLVSNNTKPEDIFNIDSEINQVISLYVNGLIENTSSRGTLTPTRLIDVLKTVGNKDIQSSIGRITLHDNKNVISEGTAIFREGKLVGYLDPIATRGYLFAIGKVKSSIINVTTENSKIAFEIIRSKSNMDVRVENNELKALCIKTSLDANIGEYKYYDKSKLKLVQQNKIMENLLNESVKKEIQLSFDLVQNKYSTDIFGFGTILHKYYPTYWHSIEDTWNDKFKEIPVEIEVNSKIRQTGIIQTPFKLPE